MSKKTNSKNKQNKKQRKKAEFKPDKLVNAVLLYCLGGAFTELMFHALVFGMAKTGALFACLYGALVGLIAGLCYALLPEKAGKILSVIVLAEPGLFGSVQLIYFRVFGTLMQLSLIKMGGDVAATFGGIIVSTVLKNLWGIALLLAPAAAAAVCCIKRKRAEREKGFTGFIVRMGATLLIFTAAVGLISAGGNLSPFSIMKSDSASTELNYQRLGISGGFSKDLTSGKKSRGTDDPERDSRCAALDEYFAGRASSGDHDYTGRFKGYNLVTICGESFSPYLISKELTPALYKLSTEGIIFNNYYGSYQSLTSNGEYTFCTGLYPNMHNNSGATSFEDSMGNYLPFCLGSALGRMGYDCFAYHNNVGEFYSRNLTHPNMGYSFKSAGSGLDIKLTNPGSDYDMFVQSVGDYAADKKPFHAYYMSWSGHNPYNWTNPMSEKNRAAVEALPYSDHVKAYIACNLELEYGLEYLLSELEKSGAAERTIIVITNDHVPYGLTAEEYNELAGFEMEGFDKFRNAFICYVPGLDSPIEINSYCSTADILPTLLNLLGADFDSRLLAGRDVLSGGPHVAILGNRSFITDEFSFDADAGKAADTVRKDAGGFTEADYKAYVDELFDFSSEILETDYYGYRYGVSGDGSAKVVDYADIANVFHKSAVQYVVSGGIMDADSDEIFGGDRGAAAGELLRSLFRAEAAYRGTPETAPVTDGEAMSRAVALGIIEDIEFEEATPLNHINTALILCRFAKYLGLEAGASAEELSAAAESYPELTEEELSACLWASREAVMNKTMDYIYGERAAELNRFQMASYVSYLCTHELGM